MDRRLGLGLGVQAATAPLLPPPSTVQSGDCAASQDMLQHSIKLPLIQPKDCSDHSNTPPAIICDMKPCRTPCPCLTELSASSAASCVFPPAPWTCPSSPGHPEEAEEFTKVVGLMVPPEHATGATAATAVYPHSAIRHGRITLWLA